jgi:hypothetical protein
MQSMTSTLTRFGQRWLGQVQEWQHVGIQRGGAQSTELDPIQGACDNSFEFFPTGVEGA